jgi:hydrogenase maturation protease
MPHETTQPKIIILGIGNLLLGDEGVGVHLVRMLNKDDLDYANLEIIDGGICPEFTSFVGDADKLIIVDAIKGGKKPGTIYRLSADDVITEIGRPLCSHQVSVIDSLKILRAIGKEPQDIIIIGIEPKAMDYGLELSSEVKERLTELKKIVVQEIEKTKLLGQPINSNSDLAQQADNQHLIMDG